MAKKTTKKTTKKSTTKKTTKKSPSSAVKKKTTKKPAAKKPAKKTTKKVAKPTAKKSPKKTVKKAAQKITKKIAKKTAKKVAKKVAQKAPAKVTKKITKKITKKVAQKVTKTTTKTATKKTSKKPVTKSKAPTSKKAPTKKIAPTKDPTKDAAKATDEANKKPPVKKFRARARKRVPADYAPPPRPLLLGPGSKLSGGPIIASSKRPKKIKAEVKISKRTKTPFTPKQLDEYKLILLNKRAELVGDVEHLEDEALRSNTGETQTASNAAEFGTKSFEQGLNLDLAAADRQLIHEIDDALTRIKERTYGLCIESHEPIKKERLEELPWAKYSIASAIKIEQRFKR